MILGRRRRPAPPQRPTLPQIRPAGRFVARVLRELLTQVRVGDDLLDIDAEAHRMIREAGAVSCYLDYHPPFGGSPFGHVICTSVNEAVLHGRPYHRRLEDGDLLSLDFAVSLDGWVADAARSVIVGSGSDEDARLIADTERVMRAGIAQARAGRTVGHIGHAVEAEAHRLGYTINDRFGGHGVGRTMHEQPFVPNRGVPGRGAELVAGMVLTVEPFLMHSTDEVFIEERDGWTVVSSDGSRGAHAEHTLMITDDEPILVTVED